MKNEKGKTISVTVVDEVNGGRLCTFTSCGTAFLPHARYLFLVRSVTMVLGCKRVLTEDQTVCFEERRDPRGKED